DAAKVIERIRIPHFIGEAEIGEDAISPFEQPLLALGFGASVLVGIRRWRGEWNNRPVGHGMNSLRKSSALRPGPPGPPILVSQAVVGGYLLALRACAAIILP